MNDKPTIDELFDRRLTYPDTGARRRLARLVGIDTAKDHLTKLLGILVNPSGLEAWFAKYHPAAPVLTDLVESRPPLVLLAGDVGTGKTELAETVADSVARQEEIDITLYPLSLATRGSGKVGEMTSLLSAAFDATFQQAKKLKGSSKKSRGAVILLIDEADAIAQSRESAQMHHEDRAGVNAVIRGINILAEQRLPAAVIMCTNRLESIDPAVLRRAAGVFEFTRPNEEQRTAVLSTPLSEVGFTKTQIADIVKRTGAIPGRKYAYTYSDLTQRFLPSLVLDAYPSQGISFKQACDLLDVIRPTPPFGSKTR
jgi:hypothetical protein